MYGRAGEGDRGRCFIGESNGRCYEHDPSIPTAQIIPQSLNYRTKIVEARHYPPVRRRALAMAVVVGGGVAVALAR